MKERRPIDIRKQLIQWLLWQHLRPGESRYGYVDLSPIGLESIGSRPSQRPEGFGSPVLMGLAYLIIVGANLLGEVSPQVAIHQTPDDAHRSGRVQHMHH